MLLNLAKLSIFLAIGDVAFRFQLLLVIFLDDYSNLASDLGGVAMNSGSRTSYRVGPVWLLATDFLGVFP